MTSDGTMYAVKVVTHIKKTASATGDFPVMYLAGVVGLILICSAGLLMLRKI